VRLRTKLGALLLTAIASLTPVGTAHADSGGSTEKWKTLDRVVVDLSSQRVSLYDASDSLMAVWPVSTGSKKHPTPTGVFRVTSRSRRTFYTPHPWVTMEYMTRFNSNIGFHAIPRDRGKPIWTPLGRYGVSHGCVRLSDKNAAILYRYLPRHAEVVVQP
jgi:lipoprotein-anchoring transpeptidase ErfK/SrfK